MIPALGKPRQENCEFEASRSYTVSLAKSCLKFLKKYVEIQRMYNRQNKFEKEHCLHFHMSLRTAKTSLNYKKNIGRFTLSDFNKS
jgi:hypothetical protein